MTGEQIKAFAAELRGLRESLSPAEVFRLHNRLAPLTNELWAIASEAHKAGAFEKANR